MGIDEHLASRKTHHRYSELHYIPEAITDPFKGNSNHGGHKHP